MMWRKLSVILLSFLLVSASVYSQQVSVDTSQLRALELVLTKLKTEVVNLKELSKKQAELVSELSLNLKQKEQILADSELNLIEKENLIQSLQMQLIQADSQLILLTDSLKKAGQSLTDLSKQHLRDTIIVGGICLVVGVAGGVVATLYIQPYLTK